MDADVIVVDVAIDKDEWLRLYTGDAHRVQGYARDGRSVVFPAGILQPWMDYDGVYGTFRIAFDLQGKCCAVDKIGEVPKPGGQTHLQ